MDKLLLVIVICGLIAVISTFIIQMLRADISKTHPDLPPGIYIPGMILRGIGIIALMVAFFCPNGWIFNDKMIKKRLGIWHMIIYAAAIAFFVSWPILLICTRRETVHGCEFSTLGCIMARIIILQAVFCFVAFSTVQRPLYPLVVWGFSLFAATTVIFDLWIWGSGAASKNRNSIQVGLINLGLR